MSDASFFELIYAAMIEEREEEEDVLQQEQAAEEEECQRGQTLEQLQKKTGLEEEELKQAMKANEGLLVHRNANGDGAYYDLRKYREGQPNWQPGVNF
jgi:hypothetical protein